MERFLCLNFQTGDLDEDGVNDLAVGADKDNAEVLITDNTHYHMNTDGSVDSTVD